jgi:ubiquinone/menaquinone biosynthesis C-methylase UbiE
MSHQLNRALGKWGESAFYWEKHRETIQKMFAPITRAMIEDTRLEANHLVLDVAGGTGEPSLTIAREFGALISIVSTDVVAEMVIAARRESRRRGLTNVTFCQCAGEQLPFESGRFDRTICRLGVMFLPDTCFVRGHR